MVGENFLSERLIPRKRQPARIAAGVGLFAQLKIADDVLVEMTDAGWRILLRGEGDVGFVSINGTSDRGEVVRYTDLAAS